MKIVYYSILVCLCTCFYIKPVHGQQYALTVDKSFSLSKSTSFSVEPGIYWMHDKHIYIDRMFVTSGLRYRINKMVRAEVGFRLQSRSASDESILLDSDEFIRMHADLRLRIPIHAPVRLSYRYRYQSRFDEYQFKKHVSRHRLKFEHRGYEIITPYISIEQYLSFTMNEIQKTRLEFGIEHPLKGLMLEEYFMIEIRIHKGRPLFLYRLGLTIQI